MYKLIIVDDEALSRYVLRALISKKFTNIEIVGEAENGRQAIELNRQLQPDLIIMDIKMPGINGIEASGEIVKEFPNANILILTAYSNFDDIKSVLDIGVKGYILKPIKEAEVVEKINKVLCQIEEQAHQFDFKELVESKIKEIKPYMENELVSAFITGHGDLNKVESYIKFLQEDIPAGYFMLITSGQSDSEEINDCIRNRILKEKAMTIVARYLPLLKKCLFGKSLGKAIVVFIPTELGLVGGKVSNEAEMMAEHILRKLKIIGNIDALIGIGNVYAQIKDFSKSYNEAAFALRKATNEKKIVHFEALCINSADLNASAYPLDLENKLFDQLVAGDFENAVHSTNEIIRCMLDHSSTMDCLKGAMGEFISVIKRNVLKMGIHLGSTMDTCILSELSELSSTDEVEVWCKRTVYNIIEQVEQNASKNTDMISKVFVYSDKNFNKNISLERVASEVGLSSQYLSKVFKEKCGTNYIDYITKKRLEYAQELLK
ncbi:MAG: response regulator, partial [Vallitaleaceae bacterium]|nr:response regulator [Vallitaleaceae bacterium]